MLEVKDLHARIGDKEILRGINLTIRDGETHAIMGPNGSGKSTLSAVLVGNPLYEVTAGSVTFNGKDLLAMKPEDRAHEGLFLSFQYPVEIPGVSMTNFMRTAVNEKRKYLGLEPLSAADFMKLSREKRKVVELDSKLAGRSVNEGFSGGEKKRNEIFQMAMLEPKLSILDETDSGLDVDALRIVAEGVNKLKTPDTSCIVITHYQRLLDILKPDVERAVVRFDHGGTLCRENGSHALAQCFDVQNLQERGGCSQQHHVGGLRDVVLLGQRLYVERHDVGLCVQFREQVGLVGIVRDVLERRGRCDNPSVLREVGQVTECLQGFQRENHVGLPQGNQVGCDRPFGESQVGLYVASSLAHAVDFSLLQCQSFTCGRFADNHGYGQNPLSAYA